MIQERFLKLDDMAAPNGYTAPSTSEDLAYIVHFRQMCKRYHIDFSSARKEPELEVCGALTQTLTQTVRGAGGGIGAERPGKQPLPEQTAPNAPENNR